MLQVLQAEEKYQIRGRIFKNLKKAARLYHFTGFLKSNISSTCTESVLKCLFLFSTPEFWTLQVWIWNISQVFILHSKKFLLSWNVN